MSSKAYDIRLSQTNADRWVASDQETGASGEGSSAAKALIGLGIELGLGEDDELTVEELLAEFAAEDERALSEEFERKVERRRAEYERGQYSSLSEVRDRLNG